MDDLPVDYGDAEVWAGHVRLIEAAVHRQACLDAGPVADALVDAVFTSEGYGDELARRLGAMHVAVDPGRSSAQVSGTAVRGDLAGHWRHLSPPVRRGLALRVVLLGAESTGTTTVAEALAERLRGRGGAWARTAVVAEYGREFTVRRFDALRAARAHLGLAEPVPHRTAGARAGTAGRG